MGSTPCSSEMTSQNLAPISVDTKRHEYYCLKERERERSWSRRDRGRGEIVVEESSSKRREFLEEKKRTVTTLSSLNMNDLSHF